MTNLATLLIQSRKEEPFICLRPRASLYPSFASVSATHWGQLPLSTFICTKKNGRRRRPRPRQISQSLSWQTLLQPLSRKASRTSSATRKTSPTRLTRRATWELAVKSRMKVWMATTTSPTNLRGRPNRTWQAREEPRRLGSE